MQGKAAAIRSVPLQIPSVYHGGVIFNLEKNKTEPQAIVINAICKTLNINKDWLMDGTGQMNNTSQALQSAKILAELYEVAKGLSENEQRYLLDVMYKLEPGYQKHSAD